VTRPQRQRIGRAAAVVVIAKLSPTEPETDSARGLEALCKWRGQSTPRPQRSTLRRQS
jgi:hypothetical protein